MKKIFAFYPPISVVNEIEMFYLSASRYDSGFYVGLFLRTLPKGVEYVDIEAAAQCVQIGEIKTKTKKMIHYDFDKKKKAAHFWIALCDTDDWKELTEEPDCSLDLEVTVSILKCYDSKKKEIPFPKNMGSRSVNVMQSNDEYKGNGDDGDALFGMNSVIYVNLRVLVSVHVDCLTIFFE